MPKHLRVRTFAAPYERSGLAEKAYQILRDRILKGELPLGATLARRPLARELGMSLLPVSEALLRLENDGLVESRPRVGTRVCNPTAAEIREQYEVREALESQAARLFAARAGVREKLEVVRLAENVDVMNSRYAATENQDPEFLYAVHSYHLQFHRYIADQAGCTALLNAIERNQVLIFNWLFDVAARRPPLPPTFHRDLAKAISSGTPEEADRAMRHHIRYGLDTVVRSLEGKGAGHIQRVK